jgi:hypothetical protein
MSTTVHLIELGETCWTPALSVGRTNIYPAFYTLAMTSLRHPAVSLAVYSFLNFFYRWIKDIYIYICKSFNLMDNSWVKPFPNVCVHLSVVIDAVWKILWTSTPPPPVSWKRTILYGQILESSNSIFQVLSGPVGGGGGGVPSHALDTSSV